jgi:hypothetical protein
MRAAAIRLGRRPEGAFHGCDRQPLKQGMQFLFPRPPAARSSTASAGCWKDLTAASLQCAATPGVVRAIEDHLGAN